MATRMRKHHQDDCRAKIQVSALITRLTKFANGELTDEQVSPNRLNAIKLLLAKAMPDLSSVEMHSTHEGDIKHTVTLTVIQPK